MVYGIYQSAAGLQVNQYRQDVLANNLANVGTTGFKHDLTVVRERPVEAREAPTDPAWSDRLLDGMTGGSLVAPTFTSFEQGPIEVTNQPLDVAIEGDGFFVVHDGKNERYTRDGRFVVDGEGRLVTAAGRRQVVNEEGELIVIPREVRGRVKIEANGEVRAGDARFGKLRVVDFADKTLLRKTGGSVLEAMGVEPKDLQAELKPGALEGSTAEPTEMMVSMIEVSRAYQLNATLIGLADSTLGRAVNDIARIR
jgi:flagellar basal-body rod protein FlgG